MPARLPRDFYARATVTVARALLGTHLVRIVDGRRLSGLVVETEAYLGPQDPASHAYRRTARSDIMYRLPGVAYVYFIYGAHFCLNAVTEPEGTAGAVLIRAILPQEGIEVMLRLRGPAGARHPADGPGKLCQAMNITRAQNGADLVDGGELWFEDGVPVPVSEVAATPRIGVVGDAETLAREWRFLWRPAG